MKPINDNSKLPFDFPLDIWIDRKGNSHYISQMDTDYLLNCISFVYNYFVRERKNKIKDLDTEILFCFNQKDKFELYHSQNQLKQTTNFEYALRVSDKFMEIIIEAQHRNLNDQLKTIVDDLIIIVRKDL